MNVDEALCLTIYAFGYANDKTAMLTHLKHARRIYKKSIRDLSDEASKSQAMELYANHVLLKHGKKKIRAAEPGYDTDEDILNEPKEKTEAIIRTAAHRNGVKCN